MTSPGISDVEGLPHVLDQHELELWQAFAETGSATIRETLFDLYLPFARRIARRHLLDLNSGDIEFADLLQLACAGLLEALDHYDVSRGAPFRAYARYRIAGSITDGINKISERRQGQSFRRRVERERMRSLLSEEPGSDVESVYDAMADLAVGLALGFMLEDCVADTAEPSNAYESLVWSETVGHLADAVSSLPERESAIIRHHYQAGLTFDQIGSLLSISKGRVSQLHRAALATLRKRLAKADPFILKR